MYKQPSRRMLRAIAAQCRQTQKVCGATKFSNSLIKLNRGLSSAYKHYDSYSLTSDHLSLNTNNITNQNFNLNNNQNLRSYSSDAIISRTGLIRKSTHQLHEDYIWDETRTLGEGGFGAVFMVQHRLTGQYRAAKRLSGVDLQEFSDPSQSSVVSSGGGGATSTSTGTSTSSETVSHASGQGPGKPLSTAPAGQQATLLEREIKSLMELDNPQICKLFEYFMEESKTGAKGTTDVYLILELCGGSDFFDRLIEVVGDPERGKFDEIEAAILLKQMLRAVIGCHALGFVHRDIKPENFMFADKDNNPSSLKLIDLGLAERLNLKSTSGANKDKDNKDSSSSSNSSRSKNDDNKTGVTGMKALGRGVPPGLKQAPKPRLNRNNHNSNSSNAIPNDDNMGTESRVSSEIRGTLAYMPPEIIKEQAFDRTVDIWSIGVVLYAMLTGEPLFSLAGNPQLTKSQILSERHMHQKFLSPKFKSLSPEAQDICKKMLMRDRRERIKGDDALRHPFIVKCYSDEILRRSKSSCGGSSDGANDSMTMSEVVEKMTNFAKMPVLKQTALITAAHLTGSTDAEVRRIVSTFRNLDEDGNGRISLKEFTDGILEELVLDPVSGEKDETKRRTEADLPMLLQQNSVEDFERDVWAKVELSRTGDLSFTEFLSACRSDANSYSSEHWRAVFQILDANESGNLDEEDLLMLFGDQNLAHSHDDDPSYIAQKSVKSDADLTDVKESEEEREIREEKERMDNLKRILGEWIGGSSEDVNVTVDDFVRMMEEGK